MASVLIDTNIVISGFFSPNGKPMQAIRKAVQEHHVFFCQKNIDELFATFNRKFPVRLSDLDLFLEKLLPWIEILPTPSTVFLMEEKIRDVNDRPILRAAIYAGVDIILTGDRDFLESGIESPRIMTASEFLDL